MATVKFDESLSAGKHLQLSKYAGDWEGMASTWFEPGKAPDISPIKGKISQVLGGKFMMHEYEGSLMGKPFTGIMLIGYHLQSSSWKYAWIDSTHTGTDIMFNTGADAPHFTANGSWMAGNETWGWRTDIEQNDPGRLLITMYIVRPDGSEAKGVEIDYHRVKAR